MGLNDDDIFLNDPFALLDLRIDMIKPSFPALLATPSMKVLSNSGPILGAVLRDES